VLAILLLGAGVFVAFVFELPDIGGSSQTAEEQTAEEQAAEARAAEEQAAEEQAAEARAAEELAAGEELAADVVWLEGSPGSEPGQFVEPVGLIAHPSGDIYVADLGNARVQRLSAGGAFVSLWPANSEVSPSLAEPSDVAVGSAGEVYALDAAGVIYRLEPDGSLAVVVPLAAFQPYSPRGLAVDELRGRFYVSDTGTGRVLVVGMDGSLIDAWGGAQGDGLSFLEHRGIGLDSDGNVFVAETSNGRVRKLSPDGEVVAEWKVNGAVSDLAVGPDDRVYITAADRARLWVYDGQGELLGHAISPLEAASVPPGRSVAVVDAGEVVIGAGGSIVRLSLRFEP
jgi:sugar lactone lactonase YvrE